MTDHRPLIPILNSYTLDAIENSRLQRLKEKISPYIFTAVWRVREPLMNDDNPTRPFESVSADFLLLQGSLSSSSSIACQDGLLSHPAKGDTTASNTIRIFCRYFREVGVPLRLRTDGGPQFTSAEFKDFMKRWGVRHM
ncbi:uncharacterized protein LOC135205853 [Macrobrachium nipponense]|uniref:uncharacterized protein LOC135205853 n=1 Tax=Macrobrachium nipponense TaxID=159736 RepID=UPI0030C84E20